MGVVPKRIVIGLLILSGIGATVFLFSQPKKGTVEWHKREYVAAAKRRYEEDWRSRLAFWLNEKVHAPVEILCPTSDEGVFLREEMQAHWNALVRLEYLSEKVIVFSNTSVSLVPRFTNCPRVPKGEEWFFDCDLDRSRNTITVTTPASGIELWEAFWRKQDVPEAAERNG